MQIRAIVASIKISDTSNVKDDMHPANRTQRISMALAADGHDRLELETGEVFAAGVRSRGTTTDKRVAFGLEVHCSKNRADSAHNQMNYYPEVDGEFSSEPLINANFYLDPEMFSDLIENIRAKLYPTHVTIGLAWEIADPEATLRFGHAPDGSEIIWKNKRKGKNSIELTSLSFFAQPLTQGDSGIEAVEAFHHSPDIKPKTGSDPNASVAKALRLTNGLLILIFFALCWLSASHH